MKSDSTSILFFLFLFLPLNLFTPLIARLLPCRFIHTYIHSNYTQTHIHIQSKTDTDIDMETQRLWYFVFVYLEGDVQRPFSFESSLSFYPSQMRSKSGKSGSGPMFVLATAELKSLTGADFWAALHLAGRLVSWLFFWPLFLAAYLFCAREIGGNTHSSDHRTGSPSIYPCCCCPAST